MSTELEALEETVLKNERKRIVNNALDSLPDDMRVVIHLIYFEDLSYDEAGKVMKKSRKQVDNPSVSCQKGASHHSWKGW